MIEKKYTSFVSETIENFKFRKSELRNILIKKGSWLYKKNGLNLMEIINRSLEPYMTYITDDEIKLFHSGLEILRKTDFPKIDEILLDKIPMGIDNKKNVKVDGKWSYVNKLNTNYLDLSDLLVYLLDKMINDESEGIRELGKKTYKSFIEDDLVELEKFSKRVEGAIQYYFVKNGRGLEDFLQFTTNSEYNTKIGDIAEDIAIKFLKQNGFDILFHGQNGDFIDMVFGVDIIAYDTRGRFGFKTIQVKNNAYDIYKKFSQYKDKGLDWGIGINNNDINIYNLQNNYNFVNIIDSQVQSQVQPEINNPLDLLKSKIDINLPTQDIIYDNKTIRIKLCQRIELYKNAFYYVRNIDDLDTIKVDGIDQLGIILNKNNKPVLYIFNSPKSIKIKHDQFKYENMLLEIPKNLFDVSIDLSDI